MHCTPLEEKSDFLNYMDFSLPPKYGKLTFGKNLTKVCLQACFIPNSLLQFVQEIRKYFDIQHRKLTILIIEILIHFCTLVAIDSSVRVRSCGWDGGSVVVCYRRWSIQIRIERWRTLLDQYREEPDRGRDVNDGSRGRGSDPEENTSRQCFICKQVRHQNITFDEGIFYGRGPTPQSKRMLDQWKLSKVAWLWLPSIPKHCGDC